MTHGLYQYLAQQPAQTAQIKVSIEGPYGNRMAIDRFENDVSLPVVTVSQVFIMKPLILLRDSVKNVMLNYTGCSSLPFLRMVLPRVTQVEGFTN